MTRSVDIAEFNLSDGLTPRQVGKLNHNFRQILRQLPQFMEGESGGGGDVPEDIADYIVETGTSNGWKYQQYASGRITATCNYNVSCATTGQFVAMLTLPKTMADTTYIVLTQVPNWCIDECRFNSLDRTTTTVPLVYHVAYSDASTIDFMCYLDGTVA